MSPSLGSPKDHVPARLPRPRGWQAMSEVGGHARAGVLADGQIAGFWRRIFALLVDCLVLGVPAALIGNLFFDELAALGQNGRGIGFVISLLYFGVLNSRIGNGQSIGKRILGVRVVGVSGRPIGLPRALLRSFILSLPFYLNGFDLTPFVPSVSSDAAMLTGVLASFFVFGFGGAITYLYVFNTKTRQSLHDLAVESFVVKAQSEGEISGRIWPVHFAVAIVLLAVGLALPSLLFHTIGQTEAKGVYTSLQNLQDELAKDDALESVTVNTQWFTFSSIKSGSNTTSFLVVSVRLRKRSDDVESVMHRVAARVLRLEPKLLGQDKLKVIVMSGFDIGIARVSNSQIDVGTPEEWRKKFGSKPPVI